MIPEWRGSGRTSMATSVIVHNTGGMGEQIRHGIDGFTFNADCSGNDWQEIYAAKTPYERMGIPAYNRLAKSLAEQIESAIKMFHSKKRYSRMLAEQPVALSRNSWLPAVFGLTALIDQVSKNQVSTGSVN